MRFKISKILPASTEKISTKKTQRMMNFREKKCKNILQDENSLAKKRRQKFTDLQNDVIHSEFFPRQFLVELLSDFMRNILEFLN